MQRDLQKHYGGMWELTAGGSALSRETAIECASRELKEETGIISNDLIEIKRIVHEGYQTLYVVYLHRTDLKKMPSFYKKEKLSATNG
ncbi:hydrolase, NUDIX family [Treponema pedis str. T A4]|uniref:Hydrolase, NUDIX family n=2 Tax=Treponema pedis TaxID=409322 RepID=S6A8I3_9SPIR|nr:hydrolase, NUDIX family [Treponema pedis str. T A4]